MKITSIQPIYIWRRILHPFSGKKRSLFIRTSPMIYKKYRFIPNKKDLENLHNIPVFIISYDRLSYVVQMVEALQKYGMKNIHIIDNKSSYKPLIKWLKTCPCTVHYMDKNWGHEVFWRSGQFKKYMKSVYIVTDPDIELNKNLPPDWLETMYQKLGEYRNVTKIGFELRWDDLPNTLQSKNIKNTILTEYHKIRIPCEDLEMYLCDIDTIFALYRPGNPRPSSKKYYQGIRIVGEGRYLARHIPWYFDKKNETEEDRYYKAHANKKISNWAAYESAKDNEHKEQKKCQYM